VIISWPSLSPAWAFQESFDLNTTNWTDVPITPVDDGTNKSVVVLTTLVGRFYRLKLSLGE
jgi:hypothetical protein